MPLLTNVHKVIYTTVIKNLRLNNIIYDTTSEVNGNKE